MTLVAVSGTPEMEETLFWWRSHCRLDGVDVSKRCKAADDVLGWALLYDEAPFPPHTKTWPMRLHHGDVEVWFDPPLTEAEVQRLAFHAESTSRVRGPLDGGNHGQ